MSSMDAALRQKEEVKRYYLSTATVGLPEACEILALLAADEERHGHAIRAVGNGTPARLAPSGTLDKARYLLRRLAVIDAGPAGHPDELELYYRAMDWEASSAGAYNDLAQQHSGWEQELLLSIAAEEEIHFTLLEEMRELLDPSWENEAMEACEVAVDGI